MIKAICAVNNEWQIGKEGKMMWRSSEDFKHFKTITMGGILIVGRTTFDNDLRGKGLPGRTTIVVGKGHLTLGAAIVKAAKLQCLKDQEIEETRRLIDGHNYLRPGFQYDDEVRKNSIWIIGGESIYRQTMPLVDELHISIINDNQIGDRQMNFDGFKGKTITYRFDVNN